jgi:hypothetical protein
MYYWITHRDAVKALSVLYDSLASWPLAIVAITLIALGGMESGSASTALAGAGAALAGAAATEFSGLLRQRRAQDREDEKERRRDLDETRRLAYMALMSKGTRSYEVAATIANALGHHQQADDIADGLAHLTALANGDPDNGGEREAWLNGLIEMLSIQLGDRRKLADGYLADGTHDQNTS